MQKKKSTPLFLMHFFVGHTNFVVVCVEIKSLSFLLCFFSFHHQLFKFHKKKNMSAFYFLISEDYFDFTYTLIVVMNSRPESN